MEFTCSFQIRCPSIYLASTNAFWRPPAVVCFSPCAGIKALACRCGVLPSLLLRAVAMTPDQKKCRLWAARSWNTSHVFAAVSSSRLTPLRSTVYGPMKLQMFGTSNDMRSSPDTHPSPSSKPEVAFNRSAYPSISHKRDFYLLANCRPWHREDILTARAG